MGVEARLVEYQEPRAQLESLGDVVGHHEHGERQFLVQLTHQLVHVGAYARIQCAERLVEQQDAGRGDERLRQRQALLHAAGKLRGVGAGGGKQPHAGQHPLGLLDVAGALAAEGAAKQARTAQFQAQEHVAEHGEMGKHGVALEDHAAIAVWFRRQRLAGQLDHALARRDFAKQQAQEGGLAAAGSADDGHEFAGLDGQMDVLQHDLLRARRTRPRIALPNVAHVDERHEFAPWPAPYHGKRSRFACFKPLSSRNAKSVIQTT